MLIKKLWKIPMLIFALGLLNSCEKKNDVLYEKNSNSNTNETKFESKGYVVNDMVLEWNENVMKVIGVTPSPPPIHSRYATMAQIAVYDALNAIIPKYKPYALLNTRNKLANPDAAVASAAYWTFKNLNAYLGTLVPSSPLLPLQGAGNNWDGWYATSLAGIPDGAEKDAGIAVGKLAAEAIMANRADDHFVTARAVYLPYVPQSPAIGEYRFTVSNHPATPPQHNGGLPLWTQMRSFAGMNNDQFRPSPPPAVNSPAYSADYNEVKTLGARVGSTRTADQSEIANFWQEGATAIWNRFFREAILNKKVDAWRTARFLAIANTAIFDAFLTSFDGLYHYYIWRPETGIRLGENDNNPQTSGIADWLPYVTDIKHPVLLGTPTPPIPEYPNPNATVGAAAVKTLQLFFETDKTSVSIKSLDPLSAGVIRNYTSFSQAGTDNFNSRIYAGFNFRYSMIAGDGIGIQVADYVFNNVFNEN